MGLASSKNKNVIRFLLRWIYTFLLEPEICCAVQGSTMKKYIIRLPLQPNTPIKFWVIQVTALAELVVTQWIPGVWNEAGAWLCCPCLKPACSQSGCSMWCNPRSAKSLELVIDCVRGAVSFMSQCTIYTGKVRRMVCPPQLGGALIRGDALDVQCRALMEKLKI